MTSPRPEWGERDDPVVLPLDPEEALRALLAVPVEDEADPDKQKGAAPEEPRPSEA